MIVHFDHKEEEKTPHNTVCEVTDCKHNLQGYCGDGVPGLVYKEVEHTPELDTFKPIHSEWLMELQCSGYERSTDATR